jgi:hypothetical protein
VTVDERAGSRELRIHAGFSHRHHFGAFLVQSASCSLARNKHQDDGKKSRQSTRHFVVEPIYRQATDMKVGGCVSESQTVPPSGDGCSRFLLKPMAGHSWIEVASLQRSIGCFNVSQGPADGDGKKDGKGKEEWLGTQYS